MTDFGEPRYFPPPDLAPRNGLLAIGGRLDVEWLLDAYRHGIFPWPHGEGTLAWFSPDPRAVFEFDRFHVSRRLARTVRGSRFQATCDHDFAGVIEACATVDDRAEHMWLTRGMRTAYKRLHRQGHAHSVEVWRDGELVGGVYGVAMGGVFAAESMFHTARDASKVALVHLVRHLKNRGFLLLDIQQMTSHSVSLGAVALPRRLYLRRLREAIDLPVTFGDQMESG
jgi:leucyl/phenylalanyl-tRNA--protein transferase